MIYRLKFIRLAIALAIFIIFALEFIGIPALLPKPYLIKVSTWLQFVPSILKYTVYYSFFTAGGFFVILILTLLFGRVYCSMLCPLGIFQDFISRFSKLFKKRKIFRFSKSKNILRFSILSILILSLLTGSIFLLNILDPYSIFGKIFSSIFRPIAILLNDFFSKIFENFNIYSLAPVGVKEISIVGFIFSTILFFTIFIFSYFRGRLFCNTICPVGSGLSLLSKYSFFKIKINESQCTRCGKCSTQCKSECIDIKAMKVDFDRCVACYNCINVCPEKGIHYYYSIKQKDQPQTLLHTKDDILIETGRRSFVHKAFLIFGSIGFLSFKTIKDVENLKSGKNFYKKKNSVTPPGSYSLSHFTSKCTACQLCVSVCPTQVLQPSSHEFGITASMLPFLDFDKNFCNYDCTKCSEVCPNGALIKISMGEKKATQLGRVVFFKKNCIVYTDETSCGACSEHCPSKAVQMVPYKNKLTIPETNINICVGCGACEYACPTKPYKAIYVEGNPIHRTAFKPKSEKQKDRVLQDFPF